MFSFFVPIMRLSLSPDFVVKNIHGMRNLRKSLGLGYRKVVKGSGCAKTCIIDYERNATLPMKKNYNKLAAFFGWEVWQ